ncbi:hypothetical protein HZB74_02210 [Candidatus Saccharibacteria bacterium]|nr:hypothetical protein [Candidatus Saccharibacteria bacterium]
MVKNKKRFLVFVIAVFITLSGLSVGAVSIYAQSSSTNYKVEEVIFGNGGELESCSGSYCAQSSTGSPAAGNTSSTNYDANGGFLTQSEPFLEMAVTGATVSFGTMNDTTTSYGSAQAGACNCSFYIRTYLSSQYVIVTASQPPTNESGDSLDAKSTLGAPITTDSVEEFGINVVDNSSPNIGANPVNQPDNTFADGKAETGYDTPNQFKYGVGDIIARSQATAGNPAIGVTEYTISYIAKPGFNTPAGFYEMAHDLIAIPTF